MSREQWSLLSAPSPYAPAPDITKAMSGNINIAGVKPVDDPSYRYKMPKLIPKLEGRGNGSKTCIANCKEVAQSLHRTPQELIKFFGVELGAQSIYGQDERCIVNGHHSYDLLYTALTKYIEEFVLCPNCRQPEVPKYKIKGGLIHKKCLGCGHVSTVNPQHKLCTFILKKHVQDKKKEKKSKLGIAEGQKEGKKRRDKSKQKEPVDDEAGDGGRASSCMRALATRACALPPSPRAMAPKRGSSRRCRGSACGRAHPRGRPTSCSRRASASRWSCAGATRGGRPPSSPSSPRTRRRTRSTTSQSLKHRPAEVRSRPTKV